MKHLSTAVTSVLKLFYNETDAANGKSKLFIGAKTKTVQNSSSLAKAIKNLNKRNKVLLFSTPLTCFLRFVNITTTFVGPASFAGPEICEIWKNITSKIKELFLLKKILA